MRLGDLDALKKDFETRRESCVEWEKKAVKEGNDEIATRALATYDFIGEVIMTINNAPTVTSGLDEIRPKGKWHHSGECSVCHKRSLKTTPLGEIIGLDFTDFCKNCGAQMEVMPDD